MIHGANEMERNDSENKVHDSWQYGTKEEHRLEWIIYLQIAVLLLSPEL
jgi:hypothetical protein